MRYRAPKAKFKSDAMQVDAAREGQGHRGSTPLTSTISKRLHSTLSWVQVFLCVDSRERHLCDSVFIVLSSQNAANAYHA